MMFSVFCRPLFGPLAMDAEVILEVVSGIPGSKRLAAVGEALERRARAAIFGPDPHGHGSHGQELLCEPCEPCEQEPLGDED